jgi:hypothetical protein
MQWIANTWKLYYRSSLWCPQPYVEHYIIFCFMSDDICSKNAFSNKLSTLGFNLYLMLVIDLMHDFELGVWKALFIHLLRMLNAVDKVLVDELDRR